MKIQFLSNIHCWKPLCFVLTMLLPTWSHLRFSPWLHSWSHRYLYSYLHNASVFTCFPSVTKIGIKVYFLVYQIFNKIYFLLKCDPAQAFKNIPVSELIIYKLYFIALYSSLISEYQGWTPLPLDCELLINTL